MLERAWMIVAGLCLLVAAAFWWHDHINATFVAATLGVLAWFLNLRGQLKKKIVMADEPLEGEEDDFGEEEDEN
jgi:hypothetical protein